MTIHEKFYTKHKSYWKIGSPVLYEYYLNSIMPNGVLFKHEGKYYLKDCDNVYKCGTQLDKQNFAIWVEANVEDFLLGPTPDD